LSGRTVDYRNNNYSLITPTISDAP